MAASSRDRLASTDPANEASAARGTTAMLRWLTLIMLGLLLLQLVIGVFVNLFVTVPNGHPGSGQTILRGAFTGLGWAIASGLTSLALHVLVGLLVGLGSIVVLVVAIRSGRRGWMTVAIVGLLATLYAGLNGLVFMDAGKNDDNSLEMTVGFVIAIATYIVGLILPRRGIA